MSVSVPGYKDVSLCLRSLIATDCIAIVLGSSDSCGERGGGDPAGQLGSGSAHSGLRRAGDGAASRRRRHHGVNISSFNYAPGIRRTNIGGDGRKVVVLIVYSSEAVSTI